MKILPYILVFSVVIGLCVVGLALNLLLRKNGKFPETEVGSNKNMRKLGITCTKQEEMKRWKKSKRKKITETAHDCGNCSGCGL